MLARNALPYIRNHTKLPESFLFFDSHYEYDSCALFACIEQNLIDNPDYNAVAKTHRWFG